MTSSAIDETPVPVQNVRVTNKMLEVVLRDGRTLSVPLEWSPRLAHGSPTERQRWRLIGEGIGIHWPDLDTDDLARESGFANVDDLLRVAKHGSGDKVYLIRFHYLPPGARDTPKSALRQASR